MNVLPSRVCADKNAAQSPITTAVNSAMGHTEGQRSAHPSPLSMIPRMSRLKYVNGKQLPMNCAHFGMPANGNMKPDRRMFGRK